LGVKVKQRRSFFGYTEKNGFVSATKLGTTNNFFVAATKNFAASTKRFVDRTKHFVVVTKYFCYPYFNKNDFVGITKPFIPCNFKEKYINNYRNEKVLLRDFNWCKYPIK